MDGLWTTNSKKWDVGSSPASQIKSGKLADLVVFDANPLENIRNTNSARYVMKNGPDNSFFKRTLETLKR